MSNSNYADKIVERKPLHLDIMGDRIVFRCLDCREDKMAFRTFPGRATVWREIEEFIGKHSLCSGGLTVFTEMEKVEG